MCNQAGSEDRRRGFWANSLWGGLYRKCLSRSVANAAAKRPLYDRIAAKELRRYRSQCKYLSLSNDRAVRRRGRVRPLLVAAEVTAHQPASYGYAMALRIHALRVSHVVALLEA